MKAFKLTENNAPLLCEWLASKAHNGTKVAFSLRDEHVYLNKVKQFKVIGYSNNMVTTLTDKIRDNDASIKIFDDFMFVNSTNTSSFTFITEDELTSDIINDSNGQYAPIDKWNFESENSEEKEARMQYENELSEIGKIISTAQTIDAAITELLKASSVMLIGESERNFLKNALLDIQSLNK